MSDEEDVSYTIEKILSRRRRSRVDRQTREKVAVIEYLVKWEGYGDEDNTWEKREDLFEDGHGEDVEEYDRQHPFRASSQRRARSKTPTPKEREQSREEGDKGDKGDVAEEEDHEEEEEGEEGSKGEQVSSSETPSASPREVSSVDKVEKIHWFPRWLFIFLLLISCELTIESFARVKPEAEEEDATARLLGSLFRATPAGFSAFQLYLHPPATEYRIRSSVALLWLSVAEVQHGLLILLNSEVENTYLFWSLALFAAFFTWAMHALQGDGQDKVESVVTLGGYGAVVASVAYLFYEDKFTIRALLAVAGPTVAATLCALFKAMVGFLNAVASGRHVKQAVLNVTVAALAIVHLATVILHWEKTQVVKFAPGQLLEEVSFELSTGNVKVPIHEIVRESSGWLLCFCVMCSAMLA